MLFSLLRTSETDGRGVMDLVVPLPRTVWPLSPFVEVSGSNWKQSSIEDCLPNFHNDLDSVAKKEEKLA